MDIKKQDLGTKTRKIKLDMARYQKMLKLKSTFKPELDWNDIDKHELSRFNKNYQGFSQLMENSAAVSLITNNLFYFF